MNLELESGLKLENPTPDQVSESLRLLDGTANSFAILAKDRMTYIQASGGPESGFSVEYQSGSLAKHFATTRLDLPFDDVDAIFRAYAVADPRWKEMTIWAHQDLASAKRSKFPFLLSLLSVGIVTLYLWWKNAA